MTRDNNNYLDRVRPMGENHLNRLITILALIILTAVNAINAAFFQASFIGMVLGILILIFWMLDMRLMYLGRKTNPKEVWGMASPDAKRLPVALTVLISLFGFYAFGWLHMGMWVWVMATYVGIRLAYKLLVVVMMNDELSSYIEQGTYVVAIVVSLFGIANVNNDMKGLPMLGFFLALYPFIAGIIGKKDKSFFVLKLIWLALMWVAVACKGSVIAAILATVLFGIMMSFNNTVTTSQHRSDNVIPFRTRDGRTVNPYYSRDENETIIEPDKNFIGILLPKFHPYIPYTWIPNPFRTIWVKQTQKRIELFEKRFMLGEDSTDLALLGISDIDSPSDPLLTLVGFSKLRRIKITLPDGKGKKKWFRKEEEKDISFCVSKKFGDFLKENLDSWADWTCGARGIKRLL